MEALYTIIRFVSTSAKWVMGLTGTLLDDKMRKFKVEVNILASTSVPFRPTTEQVPIFALTNMKRIRVYIVSMLSAHGLYDTGRLFFMFFKVAVLNNQSSDVLIC